MDTGHTNPLDDFVERFLESAAAGDNTKLAVFLKGTLDVNSVNGKGWNALMFAARNGHLETAKALLDKRCDVSMMNASGQTALDIAHFWNHSDIVSLLSNPGAANNSELQTSMPNQGMIHYFGVNNTLDRCAHRRKDANWLENAMKSETTQFILFNELNPYVIQHADYTDGKVANAYTLLRVRYSHIKEYLESKPLVIFLGEEKRPNNENTIALFVVESSGLTETEVKQIQPHSHAMTSFFETMQLDTNSAAILAQARPVLAWHDRYAFCPTCGSKAVSDEGGYKRTCTKKDCKSLKGIHNTSYPRVDPTAIMAVVSPDGKHLLLGHAPKMPKGMWSCLAGFMEPGESIEDTCRREVKEEAGVEVGRVDYHSCQSWPNPTSLMIGCIAYATTENIQIDKEELEAARWFSRREVVQMLTRQHPDGLFCPPHIAIAHHLVKTWVNMTSNL